MNKEDVMNFESFEEIIAFAVEKEKEASAFYSEAADMESFSGVKKTLEEIADFAVEHDLLVLSDEAYEKFVYDGKKHVSFASLNGMGKRTITLQSFSKTYAMPGFRVGYAAGPENIISAIKKVHIYSTICAPTISQVAALEALTGPQNTINKMLKSYDQRRKLVIKRVNEMPGFSCVAPGGAFYAFPNIRGFGMSSLKFSRWLLTRRMTRALA